MKSVEATISKLCPPWVQVPTPSFSDPDGDPFLELPFSEEKFDIAISNVNLNSSPGLDRIYCTIITELPREATTVLLSIYNHLFASQLFPNEWRRYGIFFIPKDDRKKFRPISLVSCFCTFFEKMMSYRINWWMEYFNKLPSTQFGLRKSKCCMDNISILYSDILRTLKHNAAMPALFLDIESAYDNVLADILIEKLKYLGFLSNMMAFIFN